MVTVSAHFAGNTNWNRALALGVFNQPIVAGAAFDVKNLVAVGSMNYQHSSGNMVVLTAILPVLLAGQEFYFGVGAYDGFNMQDITLRFSEMV
jgi:hypothetical protein